MQNTGKNNLKDNSTISKGGYIGMHIYYSIVVCFAMYNVLPHFAKIAYFDNSIKRLIICMVATGVIGILFTYSYNRTYAGLSINIASGMGLYVACTIGKYFAEFIFYFLLVMVILTAICMFLIFNRKIINKKRKKQIIRIRCLKCIKVIRVNAGIVFLIMLIAFPLSLKFFKNERYEIAYNQKVKEYKLNKEIPGINKELTVNTTYGDEYRLSENIDKIKVFRDDETFQTLTYEQKCDAIRALIYCEARYMGLYEIDVVFKELKDKTRGEYVHEDKTIYVDSRIIKDGGTNEEIMNICLHESRHVYQHMLVELYIKATPEQRNLIAFTGNGVANWVENYKDYHSSTDDEEGFMKYYQQPIEVDARNYAEKAIKEYFVEIDELLKE